MVIWLCFFVEYHTILCLVIVDFFHSLFFALIFSVIAMLPFYFGYGEISFTSQYGYPLVILFWISVISHPILDIFTNGGHGVALFSPFWTRRFIANWGPIKVSPMGIHDFCCTSYGQEIMESEQIWIWGPGSACVIIASIIKLIINHINNDNQTYLNIDEWVVFGLCVICIMITFFLVPLQKRWKRNEADSQDS